MLKSHAFLDTPITILEHISGEELIHLCKQWAQEHEAAVDASMNEMGDKTQSRIVRATDLEDAITTLKTAAGRLNIPSHIPQRDLYRYSCHTYSMLSDSISDCDFLHSQDYNSLMHHIHTMKSMLPSFFACSIWTADDFSKLKGSVHQINSILTSCMAKGKWSACRLLQETFAECVEKFAAALLGIYPLECSAFSDMSQIPRLYAAFKVLISVRHSDATYEALILAAILVSIRKKFQRIVARISPDQSLAVTLTDLSLSSRELLELARCLLPSIQEIPPACSHLYLALCKLLSKTQLFAHVSVLRCTLKLFI